MDMDYERKWRNDFICVKYGAAFKRGGTEYIQSLIEKGIEDGTRCATITGKWNIESHIRIPSDFTLYFDGCYLKMGDETFDNMFVNEHHGTDVGRTVAGTDRNIRLIGRNGAILDGGSFNGLSERTSRKNGMPPIYMNNMIFFTNVDGFETTGLTFHNFRWWAMNHIFCSNGYIHDLDFKADDTCIDEDGNIYHGLSIEKYYDMLVKQTDGIDLRRGCHDIVIEDIRGFTGDDTVALTCLCGGMQAEFAVEGLPEDLCNITIRNVKSTSLASCVRILCQGESTLHDVLVDDIWDMSDQIPGIRGRAQQTVRIGDLRMYGGRHATPDDIYNITVRNIHSRADYALYIAGRGIGNFICDNIENFGGGEKMIDHSGASDPQ